MPLQYRPKCDLNPVHARCVNALAFHPNGLFLASADSDGVVALWDAVTGARKYFFIGTEAALALCWTIEDDSVHCGFKDGALVSLFADEIREEFVAQGVLATNGEPLDNIATSDTGRALATSGRHEIQVWTRADCREPWIILTTLGPLSAMTAGPSAETRIASMAWTGSQLLVAYQNDGVIFWDVDTGEPESVMHIASISQACLSPDHQLLAVSNLRKGVMVYTIDTQMPMRVFPSANKSEPLPVIFIHEGKGVLSTDDNGSAVVYDLNSSIKVQTLKHDGGITTTALTAYFDNFKEKYFIAVAVEDGHQATIRLWQTFDLETNSSVTAGQTLDNSAGSALAPNAPQVNNVSEHEAEAIDEDAGDVNVRGGRGLGYLFWLMASLFVIFSMIAYALELQVHVL